MSNLDVRDAFFDRVLLLAEQDRDLVFLTDDMGAFSLDKFKKRLPAQFINVGIAEQNIISIAAGLTLAGKKVYVYGIAPFITMRCYEQIKVDLCCMKLPVTIVSVGAGFAYGSDGPTHHATCDVAIMRALPDMCIFNPSDAAMTSACADMSYRSKIPVYVRVERGVLPELYGSKTIDFSTGLMYLNPGRDITIIATGIMVHTARKVAEALAKHSWDAGVVDFYRIKPVNEGVLQKHLRSAKRVVTLEEHSIVGGIGSIISETMADHGITVPLKRLALNDANCYAYGSREWLNARSGLDVDGIVKRIMKWRG